ncbi:10 kDa chaperonin, putative [Hepatocystis sp. ex Piliocolobus tephrosceles]|nr:10 kDa chaperonin, putative [Hepatocystis sp. ex Piliocolobus tephrosceles]
MSSTITKKFIPLLDRILISKIVPKTTTKSGLFLPESATEPSYTGKVLAVGPGRITNTGNKIPPSVKEGDIVVLPEYGGSSLKIDGEEFHVYRDDDIIGIIKDE